MRTSVLTVLIENLAKLQEFIPDEKELLERVVDNIMKSLRRQLAEFDKLSGEEKIIASKLGVTLTQTTAMLQDPDTRTRLEEVGLAALRYYNHVEMMEKVGDVGAGDAN